MPARRYPPPPGRTALPTIRPRAGTTALAAISALAPAGLTPCPPATEVVVPLPASSFPPMHIRQTASGIFPAVERVPRGESLEVRASLRSTARDPRPLERSALRDGDGGQPTGEPSSSYDRPRRAANRRPNSVGGSTAPFVPAPETCPGKRPPHRVRGRERACTHQRRVAHGGSLARQTPPH